MEHFAHVVEQIDDKIAAIKLDIKETELHLHEQLRSGAPIEQFSDLYFFLY